MKDHECQRSLSGLTEHRRSQSRSSPIAVVCAARECCSGTGHSALVGGGVLAPVNASTAAPVGAQGNVAPEDIDAAMAAARLMRIVVKPAYIADHSTGSLGMDGDPNWSLPCICHRGPEVAWESQWNISVESAGPVPKGALKLLYLHQYIDRSSEHYYRSRRREYRYLTISEYFKVRLGHTIEDIHWGHGEGACAVDEREHCVLSIVVLVGKSGNEGYDNYLMSTLDRGTSTGPGAGASRTSDKGYPRDAGEGQGKYDSSQYTEHPVFGAATKSYGWEYFPWHCAWPPPTGAVPSSPPDGDGGTPTPPDKEGGTPTLPGGGQGTPPGGGAMSPAGEPRGEAGSGPGGPTPEEIRRRILAGL